MPYYSEEFKEQIVRKMMAPNAQSVAEVSRESGISEQSLYNWRNRYRHEGKAVPADPSNPENWSGENKLAVVIESAVPAAVRALEHPKPYDVSLMIFHPQIS